MKTVMKMIGKVIGTVIACVMLAVVWGLVLISNIISLIAVVPYRIARATNEDLFVASSEFMLKLIELMGFVRKETDE